MFTQKVHSTGVKNCSVFEVHNSGLYPALERLPFSGFQSSLIADRRGSAIRPAARNPAKGKPLLRQGADGNRSQEGDISFHFHHSAPCFLKAFDMGESCPLRIRLTLRLRRCGFPHSKSRENYGSFPLNCSKKYPLPVDGLCSGLKLITGCFFWKRFALAL